MGKKTIRFVISFTGGETTETATSFDLLVYKEDAGIIESESVFGIDTQDELNDHIKELKEKYNTIRLEKEIVEVFITNETNSSENPGFDVDVFSFGGDRMEYEDKCGFATKELAKQYIVELESKYTVIFNQ